MDELTIHPVARSLSRRHMLLGGERGLVLTSLVTTVMIVLILLYHELFWLVIPTGGLELGALALFRVLAQRDPYLAHVYWRRMWNYRHTYPPLPIPGRTS